MHTIAAVILREVADGDLFRMSEQNNASVLCGARNMADQVQGSYYVSIIVDRLESGERGKADLQTL